MHRRVEWIGSLVALLLSAAAPGGAAIIQVTDIPLTRFVSIPSISGDGRYIALGSNGNLGGLNATLAPNVFVYELPTGLWTRITADGGFDPTISADGRWVALTSSADYVRRNLDGSDEIFRYDRLRKRFLQVTRDINGDGSSELPVISGSGKRIAFETSSNLRRRNPDFSNEVYLFNRSGNIPLSIDINGDGESHSPAIGGDGSWIAFTSSSDLTGNNPNFSQVLFTYDLKKRDLSQMTFDPDGFGESDTPAMSGDSRFIVFISSTNIEGLNPDNTAAVFLLNRARHFTLITTSPDGVWDGDSPTINDGGRFIAFVSGFNVVPGGNPDFNGEILLYDRERKTFAQITDSASCTNANPKLTGDGTRIAYLSNCNYVGSNTDHSFEVFVADNPALNLVVHSEGPVGLVIHDPNGLSIDPINNSIPRATYVQGDFDNDTQPEDRVTIPQAVNGAFHIDIVADPGATSTDPVTLDATLNGITTVLASGTIADLAGTQLSFANQGFARRSSRITPLNGTGSSLGLSARLRHVPAASGPVRVRFTDGVDDVQFDFPNIENIPRFPVGRIFKGGVNGFVTSLRIIKRADDTTSISLSATDGDLSMFAGTADISMVMIVQIGADTDMYQFRFKRRLNGSLILK